ncbi:MAG: SDR family oxidoreductase [Bacteroidota bacterium]
MAKLLVVTGGSKGIGRAIIKKFASEGFDTITCSRNKADFSDINGEVHHLVANMSVKSEIKAFTDFVAGFNRPVDVLVNNAGYFLPGQVIDEPEGTLESMIEGNLYSAYYTSRGIAPAMRTLRNGHIFNMCSIASIQAYPNGGSYAISKFAMLGLSKMLREELKESGVRVTAVLPGATLTASWEGTNLPDERFINSIDVAEAVWGAYNLSKRTVVEEILIRPQLGDL